MSDYLKKLIVEPDSKIRLKDFDPDYHGKHESRKSALPEIEENRQKMQELQFLMYAENKHSLLIVLQGLDAGGKDGVVRHVLTGMNPSGCVSVNFKQPTAEDLDHDFLWRVHPHVPGKGSVAIFNRSHYEDVPTKTSTKHAPWFIIPSNHKWFRNLSISQIIARTMEEMDMQFPQPSVNLGEIRRKYHQAADEEKSGRSKKR